MENMAAEHTLPVKTEMTVEKRNSYLRGTLIRMNQNIRNPDMFNASTFFRDTRILDDEGLSEHPVVLKALAVFKEPLENPVWEAQRIKMVADLEKVAADQITLHKKEQASDIIAQDERLIGLLGIVIPDKINDSSQ